MTPPEASNRPTFRKHWKQIRSAGASGVERYDFMNGGGRYRRVGKLAFDKNISLVEHTIADWKHVVVVLEAQIMGLRNGSDRKKSGA